VNVAFLPCLEPTIYAKPSECFIEPECTIMNLKAIREDLLFQAKQFGVHLFSSSIELKDRLIGDPPKDVKAAKKSLNIWTIDLMIGIF